MGAEGMTYSESAEGVVITRGRAVAELAAHTVTDPGEVDELLAVAQVGPGQYDAYELLLALGY